MGILTRLEINMWKQHVYSLIHSPVDWKIILVPNNEQDLIVWRIRRYVTPNLCRSAHQHFVDVSIR